jgi:hypothetical protein
MGLILYSADRDLLSDVPATTFYRVSPGRLFADGGGATGTNRWRRSKPNVGDAAPIDEIMKPSIPSCLPTNKNVQRDWASHAGRWPHWLRSPAGLE